MKRTKIPVNATDGSNGASASAAAGGGGDAANPGATSHPASDPADSSLPAASTAGGAAPAPPAAAPGELLAGPTAERDERKHRTPRGAAEVESLLRPALVSVSAGNGKPAAPPSEG